MDSAEMLQFYNLTRQESILFLLLCTEGRLTGYEAAKLSGISRSNTYSALAGLVEKGAACVEEDTAVHYLAVPVEEFCKNRLRRMEEYRTLLAQNIPCRRDVGCEGYITIKGEKNIYDKMKTMIEGAKERIYLAVSLKTVEMLIQQITDAVISEKKVVIITDYPFSLDGALVYHAVMPPDQIRLIADSRYVLTGDTAFGSESTCLYSSKQNLVDLFKEALKNEIQLIKINEAGVIG